MSKVNHCKCGKVAYAFIQEADYVCKECHKKVVPIPLSEAAVERLDRVIEERERFDRENRITL